MKTFRNILLLFLITHEYTDTDCYKKHDLFDKCSMNTLNTK